ncbi:hypothetical protein BGZ94_002251 [Podila epigama]|nr:hypothetical protein BGZ94_002251 [Podila epigama]
MTTTMEDTATTEASIQRTVQGRCMETIEILYGYNLEDDQEDDQDLFMKSKVLESSMDTFANMDQQDDETPLYIFEGTYDGREGEADEDNAISKVREPGSSSPSLIAPESRLSSSASVDDDPTTPVLDTTTNTLSVHLTQPIEQDVGDLTIVNMQRQNEAFDLDGQKFNGEEQAWFKGVPYGDAPATSTNNSDHDNNNNNHQQPQRLIT